MKNPLVFFGLLFSSFFFIGCKPVQTCVNCTNKCGCYVTSDCVYCGGYGDCTKSGKLDGTCRSDEYGIEWDGTFQVAVLVDVLNNYFDAYEAPMRARTGRPDSALFFASQKIRLGKKRSTNIYNHEVIHDAFQEILDAAFGFDIDISSKLNEIGNVQFVPEDAYAFFTLIRKGIIEGVKAENPKIVERYLREFWDAHKDFHPMHTGRYYPHGHPDINPNAFENQNIVLQQRISVFLKKKK